VRRALLLVMSCCLLVPASAAAYPWPIKPFHRQHPIRANFGDPRTRFWNTLLTDGLEGPGLFQFHNGIDIAATEGTPVYPVISGTARLIDAAAVAVRSPGHKFQYFHITPAVHDGQHVVAGRTVLGRVIRGVNHVHLTEIRGHRVWNPLAAGGIAPYTDHTAPEVDAIMARPVPSLHPLDPGGVGGTVSLIAAAEDTPPLPVPGTFAGYPVAPALVTWSLTKLGGLRYVPEVPAADFRTTLPVSRDFWNVYARGSYQNVPRFNVQQYFIPGRFLYNLARTMDTRSYPNGVYEVRVHVADMRGNSSEGVQQFTIANDPRSEAGCPQAPSSGP
jgi:murein DD-endopeptidase MepM/ murein hydrolase activator NlpD